MNGVSFSLDAGKTLAIVGESGCGKSMTAFSILQLLPSARARIEPHSSIQYRGRELCGLENDEMRKIRGNKIAMIFQDPMTSLNPVIKIGQQLADPFVLHRGMDRREALKCAEGMLKKVGIASPKLRMNEYPHQLSGGMKQRVMIAMALSCNPDILIADEPTTALDVTIQAQILHLMEELKRESQTAIILITHDLGVVAEMADDVLVMYAGNVMEAADIKSLFKNPLHPYTQGLMASIPRLDQTRERLHTIDGNVPSLNDMPAGCRFSTRCPHATERCHTQEPDEYTVDTRLVKCFLYEKGERQWTK